MQVHSYRVGTKFYLEYFRNWYLWQHFLSFNIHGLYLINFIRRNKRSLTQQLFSFSLSTCTTLYVTLPLDHIEIYVMHLSMGLDGKTKKRGRSVARHAICEIWQTADLLPPKWQKFFKLRDGHAALYFRICIYLITSKNMFLPAVQVLPRWLNEKLQISLLLLKSQGPS